jgi:nitrous oxidase accessory protein
LQVNSSIAAEQRVPPTSGALSLALEVAAPGDTVFLQAGEHKGAFVISKPLTLIGDEGAHVIGLGIGHVFLLDAPGITIKGLTISGSGKSLESEDSGIFVTARAIAAQVLENRLKENLIGVYLKGARDAIVRGNEITGRRDLRMNERGNGIQIWNAPGAVIEENKIRYGRDGIFVTTSKNNVFRANQLSDLRFAIHYMYTNDSVLEGNVSRGNHVGYALMYSNQLKVLANQSLGDRDYGILMNYTNRSEFVGNQVRGMAGVGPHKCVFIYNANKNRIEGNRFENCEIGIHFTAGSERNAISANAFINNRNQVKYVGTRNIEWSINGQGNYWSDNLAFDLDHDGRGDEPYRPNGLVDQIIWRQPLAKLLLNSPATQLLAWAQSAFPALRPGGVTDSYPLMAAPVEPVTGTPDKKGGAS